MRAAITALPLTPRVKSISRRRNACEHRGSPRQHNGAQLCPIAGGDNANARDRHERPPLFGMASIFQRLRKNARGTKRRLLPKLLPKLSQSLVNGLSGPLVA